MPVSRRFGLEEWQLAPTICILVSELPEPPNTGRFCTMATCTPSRAAAIAAQTPAKPPPATTTSKDADFSWIAIVVDLSQEIQS